jgi:hypothetical protein
MSFEKRKKFVEKVRRQERHKAYVIMSAKYNNLMRALNLAHSKEITLMNKSFALKEKRIEQLRLKLSRIISEQENVLNTIRAKHEIVSKSEEQINSALIDHKISVALIREIKHNSETALAEALLAG